MYEIKVTGAFSSAHNLNNYQGKCENLHGHNWKVEIAVCKKKLDEAGLGIDFKLLKTILFKKLDKLDHTHLNKLSFFKKNNPTSENIAKYIFDNLHKEIPDLDKVTVWESDNSSASYTKD